MIYPQPHDPTDNCGDDGIVGCGNCGKTMERQEAIMVSDERVYICNPCDQTLERCADCDQPERLRGWRYEPAVRICEGCFEDRDREEEREEI